MKATTIQLAELLGISRRTLDELSWAGVIPKEARNCYDVKTAFGAFLKHREDSLASTDDNPVDDRYKEARADLYQQRARSAKIEGDLRAGTAHDAEAVTFVVGAMLHTARARLLSIPSKTAPALADLTTPEACRKVLDEAVRDAANEISKFNPADVVKRFRQNSGTTGTPLTDPEEL